jgi:hypothetical protein
MQGAVSAVATLLIGGPLGATESSSSSVGTAPAAASAASPPGGPPGASSGNELSRGRSLGRSNVGNRALRDEVDDQVMARWAGYVKSTIQFVKGKLSGVIKAMGLRRRSPVALLWEGLLEVLNRLNAQAAARNGGQPARAQQGDAAPAGPVGGGAQAPVAPARDAAGAEAEAEAEALLQPAGPWLWDQGIDGLIGQGDAVEQLEAEDPSGTYVYWAALVAASALQPVRRRVRLRTRTRSRRAGGRPGRG